MNELEQAVEQLKATTIAQIDAELVDATQIWEVYQTVSQVPVPQAEDDALLINFRPVGLDPSLQVLRLVRQLIIGSTDEIQSGLQLQIRLTYQVTETFKRQQKALKDLTRLGSWAFATPGAFLAFADGLKAWQSLLTEQKPVSVTVDVEDLLS